MSTLREVIKEGGIGGSEKIIVSDYQDFGVELFLLLFWFRIQLSNTWCLKN